MKTGGVEIDCCGVEITPNPASTPEEFWFNISTLKEEVCKTFGVELYTIPSYEFPVYELEGVRYSQEFGCSPDLNVYTGMENESPEVQGGFRTFGGHIHVGGDNLPPDLVAAMDIYLGLWSVVMDSDTRRRSLYGKAGAYRKKPYGYEYRVLSNFWCDSKELVFEVFRRTQAAVNMKDARGFINMNLGGEDFLQEVINTSNKDIAAQMLESLEGNYGIG